MKITTLFISLICLTFKGFAQEPDRLLIQTDAKLISPNSRSNGYGSIQTYSKGAKGSQFYPVTWAPGELQTTDNARYNAGYLFTLDKVHQLLFVRETATSKIMNIDKVQIKKLRINTESKDHFFGMANTYLNSKEGNFCEMLVDNQNKYSLIKVFTTAFVRADNAGFAKMKDGEFTDEFVDNASYYIVKPNLPAKRITFKEKSIEKAFSEQKTAEDYINNNQSAKRDEYFLINVVNYINDSLK